MFTERGFSPFVELSFSIITAGDSQLQSFDISHLNSVLDISISKTFPFIEDTGFKFVVKRVADTDNVIKWLFILLTHSSITKYFRMLNKTWSFSRIQFFLYHSMSFFLSRRCPENDENWLFIIYTDDSKLFRFWNTWSEKWADWKDRLVQ